MSFRAKAQRRISFAPNRNILWLLSGAEGIEVGPDRSVAVRVKGLVFLLAILAEKATPFRFSRILLYQLRLTTRANFFCMGLPILF